MWVILHQQHHLQLHCPWCTGTEQSVVLQLHHCWGALLQHNVNNGPCSHLTVLSGVTNVLFTYKSVQMHAAVRQNAFVNENSNVGRHRAAATHDVKGDMFEQETVQKVVYAKSSTGS